MADPIGCSAGCKRSVPDEKAASEAGWSLLDISQRWRCPTCTTELETVDERIAAQGGRDMFYAKEACDVTLPDGTVRHNVGSDNLSDEDRATMAQEEREREGLSYCDHCGRIKLDAHSNNRGIAVGQFCTCCP